MTLIQIDSQSISKIYLIHDRGNQQGGKASSKKDLRMWVKEKKKKRVLKSDTKLVNSLQGNNYNLWDYIFCQAEVIFIFTGKRCL